jgi:hypothetical protein
MGFWTRTERRFWGIATPPLYGTVRGSKRTDINPTKHIIKPMVLLGKKLSQNRTSFKSQKRNPMQTANSAIDPVADPRVNRQSVETKTPFLAAGLTALFFVSSSIACSKTFISSESSTRIGPARVVKAIGGGSYVTGTIEPSFGYVAPHTIHVHVAAYDANGKLLARKTDKINGNSLVRWHLRPRPRAPYTVFLPWEPSQIAKVTAWTQ